MKKLLTLVTATALTSSFSITAFATSPDVYIVNFRNNTDVQSQQLDNSLAVALGGFTANYEQVNFDTSNAAKWEKSAHEAFDRDIVPVFNKWIGLNGFAAVVDAKTKRVIGCINTMFNSSEIARELSNLSAQASGNGYVTKAATFTKTTQCPAAQNVDPGE